MAIFADKRNGKITGRWRVELQLEGKRWRKRFDTIDEAKAYEASARQEIAHGNVPPDGKARSEKGPVVNTLDQLVRVADNNLWAGQASERQAMQRLEGAVKIIGPSRLVESVTIEDTDRLVKVLRSNGKARGTINRYLSALTTAMKWSMDRGYRKAALPKLQWQDEDEGRIRWITPSEEAALMELMPRPEALVVFACIRTGLRRGEILNLQERDVEPQWVHLWGTGTKNGKGRSIPLSGDVYRALQELFELGKPSKETLRYWWAKAKTKLGLEDDEDFVFHATRHTFATRAVQSGVHPRVLQRLMGHKHLSTTMRYMQVSDAMLAAAVEQMQGSQNHIGTVSSQHPQNSVRGGLQGVVKALNAPLSTARHSEIDVQKQEDSVVLRHEGLDLGSSAARLASSSLAARTTKNSEQ